MSTEQLFPLVDADYLVYRVGFAVKDDEPVEYALSTVKHAIHNIWDRFDGKVGRLFLSGKGNFREKVATIQVYKGNRDPSQRPKYYSEIREYMIAHHNAEVVHGMEAEDACGIQQYATKDRSTVIVSQDKDLLCIPGWHYNPVKETISCLTLAESNEYFWKQVLTGDRTDNILGIPGMGPKTADKVIDPCGKEWNRMAECTLSEYRKKFGSDAEKFMDETAKLVWILRKDGETYDSTSIDRYLLP